MRVTVWAVAKSAKASSFVVGYVGNFNSAGEPVLEVIGGVTIPLKAHYQAITANHQTSDARRLGEAGSLFSIARKDIRTDRYAQGDGKRPIETVLELALRNPIKNPQLTKIAKALQG